MNPELAQHEREHELGDQKRLHDRNQAVVQGERLEQERSARATQPKSHSGLRNKYRTTRQPDDRRGPAVLAMCWVATLAALDNAASRANTTAWPP